MFLGKFGISAMGTVVALGLIVSSEGFINVKVIEKQPGGTHIHLIVPGILASVGAGFVPERELKEAREQMRPWMPTIRAALEALDDCDDAVLVQVDDRTDHVRVMKSGGSLVIDVIDPGDEVHVSVPLRAVQHTVERLAEPDPQG